MRTEEQHTHTNFKGLRNNVAAGEFDLEDLEVAQNVEINDKNIIQRRKGFAATSIVSACHSLWSGAGVCLLASGTSLLRVSPGYSTTVLRSDLTPNAPVSYYAIGDRVYYSNGQQTGVVEAGRARSWGLPVPGRIAATATSGNYRAGRYQFALTFQRNDGQESGASVAGVLELSAPGGFRFTNLPVSSDPDVAAKTLYLTAWQGERLYAVAQMSNATTSIELVDDTQNLTFALQTQHLSPAPAGQIVSNYNGRMVVASGSTLHMSRPYSPELFDRREVIQFESRIGAVAPVNGGVFVGTEQQIVFLEGSDLSEVSYRVRADYGVVPGTLVRLPSDSIGQGADGVAYIVASRDGVCALADGGGFKNLTQERFSYPPTAAGAGMFRRHRGMQQYVAVLRGTGAAANVHI